MNKKIFPEGFLWGAATADYQVEGAANMYGKGETIWDRFSHIPGKIFNNDNGDNACDHYHLYKEDVKLMKEIGLKAYRFSISWARIFPEGKGAVNVEGLDFYKRLINELIENGIKPAVTLQHWSFPQKLQDIGGWTNKNVTGYFQQYAEFVFKEFGDIVPIWITHNEPFITCYLGYYTGKHAPGITDFSTAMLVSKNLLISHGKAVETYKQMGFKGEIGITLDFHPIIPLSDGKEDIEAVKRVDQLFNKWFSDPIFLGKFPEELEMFLINKGIKIPDLKDEDLKYITQPIDFLGVNYYSPTYASYNSLDWPIEANIKESGEKNPKTEMGWEIYPEGLYETIKRISVDYGKIKIYITENGAAFKDIVNSEGKIDDVKRIDFLYKYFEQAYRCIKEGINLQGYFVWSLMDNFEWNYGYDKRFGIIYIDYETMKRIIKSSGYWYHDVIKNNGLG